MGQSIAEPWIPRSVPWFSSPAGVDAVGGTGGGRHGNRIVPTSQLLGQKLLNCPRLLPPQPRQVERCAQLPELRLLAARRLDRAAKAGLCASRVAGTTARRRQEMERWQTRHARAEQRRAELEEEVERLARVLLEDEEDVAASQAA